MIEAIKYIPTKALTHAVLKRVTDHCAKWNKHEPGTAKDIQDYISDYNIDWNDAEKCQHSKSAKECSELFETKNEFFQRKVKKRYIEGYREPNMLVSPADCRLVAYKNVSDATKFWIKGQGFTIEKLLNDKELSIKYLNGSMVICRLAPDDYHRFHIPIDCSYQGQQKIAGTYYSVDPILVNSKIDVFGDNKREVHKLYSAYFGTVLCVIVGATCVGSIQVHAESNAAYQKGDPFGMFGFGGSTIVMLFPSIVDMDICDIFLDNSQIGVETYVKVGTKLGMGYGLKLKK